MEQLPLTFVQSTVEPEIQECFTPAFNFTRINSSSGRLAFTANKLYWLPDNPMAMMDQGWVANISEIDSCSKSGIAGFIIKLKDGKELRFSNVFGNMREGIPSPRSLPLNPLPKPPRPPKRLLRPLPLRRLPPPRQRPLPT